MPLLAVRIIIDGIQEHAIIIGKWFCILQETGSHLSNYAPYRAVKA